MPLKDVVEKIKEHIDIVEVIGSRVPLKKSGKNYKGLCPFHNDKNPSFYVNPEKGFYHCFGCGASGDVIKFLQEYEKMSFVDALKYLGDVAGIKVSFTGDASEKYYQANEEAAKIYQTLLPRSQDAMDYLKTRGLTEKTIERFKIGYAPDTDVILSRLGGKVGIDTLMKVGLVMRGKGRMYDRFRNRLMFPIFSPSGRIAGFGGRALGDVLPKYMNSPESPVYSKRNSLYSFYHSRKGIMEKKSVILVEGYFDYLSMFQAGFTNVLASLGTSLTENQATIISRYASNIYLFYDMDEAGIKASFRSMGMFIDRDVNIFICRTSQGKDPDEIIQSEGTEGIYRILDSSREFIDIMIENVTREYNMQNPAHLTKVVNYFKELLSKVKDTVKRELYKERIARELMIREELLDVKLREEGKRDSKMGVSPDVRLELALLASVIQYEGEGLDIDEISAMDFRIKGIKEYISALVNGHLDKNQLFEKLPQLYRGELYGIIINGVDPVPVIVRRLKVKKIQEKLKETARKIKEMEKRGESVSTLLRLQDNLLREKLKLQREG